MEFWGVEVKSGESLKVDPGDDKIVHLSMACLGEASKDKGSEPVSLYVKFDNQKLAVGTLSSEKFPQISYDLIFEKEFELSHNWKNGSVFFTGYKAESQLASDDDEDSDDFIGEDIPAIAANGKPESEVKKIANPKKNEKDDKKDTKGEDDSKDSSEADSDEDSSEDEPMANGQIENSDDDESDDDEDDNGDDSDDEETPKKVEGSNKRLPESSKKTPVPVKKAKFVTPEKTDTMGEFNLDSILEQSGVDLSVTKPCVDTMGEFDLDCILEQSGVDLSVTKPTQSSKGNPSGSAPDAAQGGKPKASEKTLPPKSDKEQASEDNQEVPNSWKQSPARGGVTSSLKKQKTNDTKGTEEVTLEDFHACARVARLWNETFKKLKQQVSETSARIRELSEENRTLKGKLAGLASAEKDLADLRDQVAAQTKVAEQVPTLEDKLSEMNNKWKKAQAEKEREQADLEKVKKEKAELTQQIAESAKFSFQRCMELLAVIDPEFNFNLLSLGYRVQDDKIVKARPSGVPLTDADVIYAPPAAQSGPEPVTKNEIPAEPEIAANQ